MIEVWLAISVFVSFDSVSVAALSFAPASTSVVLSWTEIEILGLDDYNILTTASTYIRVRYDDNCSIYHHFYTEHFKFQQIAQCSMPAYFLITKKLH